MTRWVSCLVGGLLIAATGLTWAAAPAEVKIDNFTFSPAPLRVKQGEAVTWVNQDDEPHSVVSDTGLFRSGALDTGNSYTFKFDKPGTYHVFCSLHPRMTATIVVE